MCIPVIGIQAALAIPNFAKFECRSKQSEAKTNLKAAYVMLESFKGEHRRYGTLEESGFRPRAKTVRYEYELVDQGDDHFLMRASGQGEMAGDVWEIDQKLQLRNTSDLCDD